MKQIPKIEKFMTAMPHTIGKDISVDQALDLMRTHRIRHLPVQEGGRLVGVITDRDIKLAGTLVSAAQLKVEDVMTSDPYTVNPRAGLDEVVAEMAEHKYGCAVVAQDNGKVVGVFTTVDGLRTLHDVLRENYKPMSQ